MSFIRLVVLVFLVLCSVVANDNILSTQKQNMIKYDMKKAVDDSSKLKHDWINPITYTYTDQRGDQKSRSSTISISQPIFKSGGIFSAIKYANAVANYTDLSIKLDKKVTITKAYSLLFQIYKTNILIQKQKLLIDNAQIDLKIKKEEVLGGVLDISFLNNAILSKNTQQSALLDLQYTKQSLIHNFNALVNKDYKKFALPTLQLISKEDYLQNDIYIKQSRVNTKTKQHLKNMTRSQYLPTVNANYQFSDNYTTDIVRHNYGISVTIPFSINTFDDISSSKLDYLKTKEQELIVKRDEQNFLQTKMDKIDTIKNKKILTKQNIEAYKSLLVQIKELASIGEKTVDDVKMIENSKKAEELNLKILDYDKQLELIELYARVTNEI
jgi:outer membrane protein TolC